MPELREVFDMVTKQVEPDRDSWREQERRQRRAARNRKIGGFVAVLAILVAGGVLALTLRNTGGKGQPANSSSTNPSITASPTGQALGPRTTGPVVVALDGTVRAAIPNLPLDPGFLSVSPDGTRVVFSAYHNGSDEIGTDGVDGTGLRWLTSLPTATMPSWSPDGSRIVFAAGFNTTQRQQIYVVDADGSNVRKLTSDPGDDQWPSWSPDGSTIVYSNSGAHPLDPSGFSRTEEIFSVPANGGAPTRLTHNGTWDDMPVYSPDGQSIALSHEGAIAIMPADGGTPVEVVGASTGNASFNPRWSPDGSKIAFIVYEGDRSSSDAPLLTIRVLDLASHQLSVIPGQVVSDANAVAWMSTGDALLVNRYGG